MFYFSMALTIASMVLYHVVQKKIAPGVNPAVSLTLTYAVALVCSLLLLLVYPVKGGFMEVIRQANWTTYLLGLVIVGIELGYLLVYRSGWKISISAAVTSSFVLPLLLIIGVLFFKESLSLLKVAGLGFCLVGIVLLSV
jgi:drug/metabolite transporter (DMT)-like permease